MNESAASTTLKRIALFKVNKVPYLLEFNINWAAATHLTRVWSRWDELGKQAVGQTTVRKGRGNSTVSKSTFCIFFFLLTKLFLVYIHIFFTIESDFFKIFFLGVDNPRMGGDMSPPSPPGFTPMVSLVCQNYCAVYGKRAKGLFKLGNSG